MDQTPDELFAQARSQEAEAIRAGEETEQGRKLRAKAAELRVRALGERIYPVLVCSSCFRVTGWTDAAGDCDHCLRERQFRSAFADPHAGWVSMADTRLPSAKLLRPPIRARLAARIGLSTALDKASSREWLALVEPDETGPISPEPGYETEVAKRDEAPAADGSSNIVIRFSTATHRFSERAWQRLETTRIGSTDLLVPPEFSAGLPIEQLAEAWADYGASVDAFNARVWEQQAQSREAARQAQQAEEDALREQRHVTELLREEK
jgi:hypothetical protein